MKLTRRQLLQFAAGFGVGFFPPVARGTPASQHRLEPSVRRTLTSFFDTLIPAEGVVPGAIGVGIDTRFTSWTEERLQLRKLVVDVCRWLDREAQKTGAPSFSDLNYDQRDRILLRASRSAPRSAVRRFFDSTRNLAFFTYYGNAAGWSAIGYAGPPQPNGFLDYAQSPAIGR